MTTHREPLSAAPSTATFDDVPLALVTRGDAAESLHRGVVVVVRGEREWSLGAPATEVWTRSAVKPLQALASLERGMAQRAGLTAAELAISSASHYGTDFHVATARSLLAKLGFDEGDLGCGPHAPFDRRASLAIAQRGGKPERIHNNCSGKHAGLLWLARECGEAIDAYLAPDAVSQRAVRTVIAEMCDIEPARIGIAVDGCGAPTFRLPMVALARGFARLVNPHDTADVRARACRSLTRAIQAEPVGYEGEGGLCTALLRAMPERIVCKNGAEGLFAFGLQCADGPAIGAVVKISDGAQRGFEAVVPALLATLEGWSEWPEPLRGYDPIPIHNTQRRQVGHVRSIAVWPDELASVVRSRA